MKCDGLDGQFGNAALIVGVGSVESAFLIQWTKCLSDFDHPDYPAILVFIQYITQLEGPMWKEIRGQGLACLLYTSPSPRDRQKSRMPSSA